MNTEKIIIESSLFFEVMEDACFWEELAQDNAIDEYEDKIAIKEDDLNEHMHMILSEALEKLVRRARRCMRDAQ